MRFMIILKSDKNSEAGAMPSEQYMGEMLKFNEELIKAGVMLAGEGLHPSSKGARVKLSTTGQPTVTDGPFAEAKELIAGFWIWKLNSIDEAIEWVKRIPAPEPGSALLAGGVTEAEVEIRQVFEAEDFGAELTPELREQEQRLRAQADANAQR